MRYLNAECVRNTLTPEELMNTIEEAYRIWGEQKCYMPPRPSVEYKKKTLLYMPCFTENCIGTKILSVFPENSKKGIPAIDGLMLVNDFETGKPIAMLNGSALTAMRTGAVGGVAMRYLSRRESATAGLIGTGTQGLHQLIFAVASRDIKKVYLYRRNKKDLSGFISSIRDRIKKDLQIIISDQIDEVIRESDIVITATTAEMPVVPDKEELLKGKCFIAIGSYKPEMRELPDALWKVCPKVYTELPFAMEESGDLCQPVEAGILSEQRIVFMADYLKTKEKVDDTVCFKSVGMAVFDLMIAQKIAAEAEKISIGQIIDL